MAIQKWFTGTAAPATTPAKVGDIFIDTSNKRIYVADGTASSANWQLMKLNLSEIAIDTDLQLAGVKKIIKALSMDYQTAAEVTISGGTFTATQTLHRVDTQLDAATDDLDSVTPLASSNVLILKLEDAARVVTIKHAAGTDTFLLPDGSDIVMKTNVLYYFVHDGTNWQLMMDPGAINTGTVNGWTKQQYAVAGTLTDAVNISWNLDDNQSAKVTLDGNRTLDNPTNMKDGATYILRVSQDATTGSRTLSYGTAYKWPGGTAPVLSTAVNSLDILTFICDGTLMHGTFSLDSK